MYIQDNKISIYQERILRDQKPITGILFLTDRCNNSCEYCRFKHKRKNEMRYNYFCQYVEKMLGMGVVGVVLSGGGEPMMAEEFDSMIWWLDERQIPFGINTNGTIYRNVFTDFARYIKVSIDASSSEEYKRKRGVDRYGQVLDNVERWSREKSRGTKLGIQCVIERPGEAEEFWLAHSHLNVDYISFRPIESQRKIYTAKELWSIQEELIRLKDEDRRIVINYKWAHVDGERFKRCAGHWAYITVTAEGNVIYCCHKPDEIVGHILDENINGKIRHFATDMRSCEMPCILTGANKYIERYQTRDHWEFL